MHPKFLGQGSVSLPEKWEAMRITGPLPFSHVSHCPMGSKNLYFPLKHSSVFSGRLRNASTQCTNYQNPGKGGSHMQLNQKTLFQREKGKTLEFHRRCDRKAKKYKDTGGRTVGTWVY